MTERPASYDRGSQLFHWLSAVLILGLFPLGFLMQDATGTTKLVLYRGHVVVGIVLFLLTLGRIVWRLRHRAPEPLPMSRIHWMGMEGIHLLLYVVLFVLSGSGVALLALSTLPDALAGAGAGFPDLSELPPRQAHGLAARLYIALLLAHVGGVVVYQLREGDTLSRMGLRLPGALRRD